MKVRSFALASALALAACGTGADDPTAENLIRTNPGGGSTGIFHLPPPPPDICADVPFPMFINDGDPIPSNLWGNKRGVVIARRSLSQPQQEGYFGIDPDTNEVVFYIIESSEEVYGSLFATLDAMAGSCHHPVTVGHNHTQGQATVTTLPQSGSQSSGESHIWSFTDCDLLHTLASEAATQPGTTCNY